MTKNLTTVLAKLKEADLPTFEGIVLDGPNVKGRSFGDTPLHIVAIWGDLEAARVLVEAGAEIDARGEHQFTPLHEAVSQGKIEVAEFLLKHGANPRLESDMGDAFALADYEQFPALSGILKE